MNGTLTIHASCVVLDEAGLLLRGASGSGKSTLAAALIDDMQSRRGFARLIGDDRILIEARHGRLIARGHPAISGMIERRGFGLLRGAFEQACVLHCVVDLDADARSRLPEARERQAMLCGVALPRIVARDWLRASAMIRACLAAGGFTSNDLFETAK